MIGGALACLLQPASPFVSRAATYQLARHSSRSTRLLPSTTHEHAATTFATGSRRRRSAADSIARIDRSFLTATLPQSSGAAASATLEDPAAVGRGKPVRSVGEAKRELFALVSSASAGAEPSSNHEERVAYLLEALEGSYTPIQTAAFFNLVVQVIGQQDTRYMYSSGTGLRLAIVALLLL